MWLEVKLLLHVYASTGPDWPKQSVIDSSCGVFDLKLEQHKFVEENQLNKQESGEREQRSRLNIFQK